MQQEIANLSGKQTQNSSIVSTALSSLTTISSSVNSSPEKRRPISAAATQNNSVSTVQSYSRPVTVTSVAQSTPTTAANLRSTVQTPLAHRNSYQTSSGRTVNQRNISLKKESPRKSGRGSTPATTDNSTKHNNYRNRKQTTVSSNSQNTLGTRSKKEKLLCICRTPYDDTKWVNIEIKTKQNCIINRLSSGTGKQHLERISSVFTMSGALVVTVDAVQISVHF